MLCTAIRKGSFRRLIFGRSSMGSRRVHGRTTFASYISPVCMFIAFITPGIKSTRIFGPQATSSSRSPFSSYQEPYLRHVVIFYTPRQARAIGHRRIACLLGAGIAASVFSELHIGSVASVMGGYDINTCIPQGSWLAIVSAQGTPGAIQLTDK